MASAAFIAVGLAWVATQPADAATEEIDAGNLYFCAPSFMNGVCTTTITVGDTVTWKSVFSFHTVTECDATYATCPLPGGFDSGVLDAADGEAFSHTFDAVGDFAYFCAIHPVEMRGVISVVAAPTDTPATTQTPAETPDATGAVSPTQTPAETPDATGAVSPTVSPAAMPTSGGEPLGGGLPSLALVLALGGTLAVAGAAALYSARRR